MLKYFACAFSMAPFMLTATPWQVDLPATMMQAQEEGKLLLLNFTGSDWCMPCHALKKQVLEQPAFLEYAAQEGILLVEIDLPQRALLSPEQLERNRALADAFGVSSFPYVFLLSPEGYVLGAFGGSRAEVGELIELLELARAHGFKYQLAAGYSGLEKARALLAAHQSVQHERNPFLINAIIEADEEDILGYGRMTLRAQLIKARQQAFLAELELRKNDYLSQLEWIENELLAKDLPAELRPMILNYKGSIMVSNAKEVEHVLAAKAVYLELAALAGDRAESEKTKVEKLFADPEKILKSVQK